MHRELNPEMDKEAFINEVGVQVSFLHKIPIPEMDAAARKDAAEAQVQDVIQTPANPAQQAASTDLGIVKKVAQSNPFAQMAEDFIEDDKDI